LPIPSSEEPKPRRLVRDLAYEAIQGAILDGSFRPGEVLDDGELQRWLQVSRTPIRQALFALTLEGLVETAPQAHTRVIRPQPAQAIEYLQTLGVMLIGVTILAKRVAGNEDRKELRAILAKAIAALDQHDQAAFIREVGSYFALLTALCPNPTLCRLVDKRSIALGYNLTVVFQGMEVPWAEIATAYSALDDAWETDRTEDIERATKALFLLGDDG
jgi:DNA-binding GntR family transcriptional regulator